MSDKKSSTAPLVACPCGCRLLTSEPDKLCSWCGKLESQVQKLLGIAASTLWSYVHQGLLTPAQRTHGGHARYRESEVAAFRAQLSTVTAPAELAEVAL